MKTVTDINQRWEEGEDHHPRSAALYKLIAAVDYKLGGDSLCLSSGGDGDNGESLMFALDIIFDAEDNDETEELNQLLNVR